MTSALTEILGAPRELTIATYNLHKGLSALNRKLVIHEVRERLHSLDPDIVLLQEVQGSHQRRKNRFPDWPLTPQHEHLAGGRLTELVYGLNATHRYGHHGNAILSAYPITEWINRDVSHHRFERRGHLHTKIEVDTWPRPLHCICVHLGLFQRSRSMQVLRLIEIANELVPPDDPLIIAGDFNDWRNQASGLSGQLQEAIGVKEVFESAHGRPARTFPAMLPLFSLDRIYVRGLRVGQPWRLHGDVNGHQWHGLSDHAGLAVRVTPIT